MRADNQKQVHLQRDCTDRLLAILRRITNIANVRANDAGKPVLECLNDVFGIVDAQRCLRDIGDLFRIGHRQIYDIFQAGDQVDAPWYAPHGAFNLRMAGMADQYDIATINGMRPAFPVNLGHQWAGCINHRQFSNSCFILDLFGNAVGAKDGHASVRNVADFFDKNGALAAQGFDDALVMNDFVAHINGRSINLQRALNDLYGALNTGAESARPYQQHV